MNPFQDVFDEAFRDGILMTETPMPSNVHERVQRDILLSIHNSSFNNWLEKKFEVDLNADNYSAYCTYPNFKEYLKWYYAENTRIKREGLAERLGNKFEVGLLPDPKDMLPDLQLVVNDVEGYAIAFEPHYALFLAQLKRGGFDSLRDYINTMFYSLIEGIDVAKIVASIDMKQLPKNDHEIMEMAQVSLINAPLKLSADTLKRIAEFTSKIGETTPEEQTAQSVIHLLICKLFINHAFVTDNNRIRKAFVKIFLLQFYKDYSALLNRPVPPDLIQHLQNIQAPQFDVALSEVLTEHKLVLPVKSGQLPTSNHIIAESVTINQSPVTHTTNTVNGSGTVNTGEISSVTKNKSIHNQEKSKENWWWKTFKNWWWSFAIPIVVGGILLYCEKNNLIDIF